MDAQFSKLYDEFLRLSEAGDEQAVRTFLTDHITEFPEEVREKIVFAFFEEALAGRAAAADALVARQQEGIDTLEKIIATEKEVANTERIEELKKTLGAQ